MASSTAPAGSLDLDRQLQEAVETSKAAHNMGSRYSTSNGARKTGGKFELPFLKLGGVQHFLKLRSTARLNKRLTADYGVDFNLATQAMTPQAALSYELNVKGQEVGLLRATPHRLVLRRSFDIDLNKASFRLDASAGANYEGKPDFGVDFGNIQPPQLAIAAAGVLLLLKQPLSGSKTFGGVRFSVPLFEGEAELKGEARAQVQRTDNLVALTVKQLNAVVRV